MRERSERIMGSARLVPHDGGERGAVKSTEAAA
jgi:hypothetical protein